MKKDFCLIRYLFPLLFIFAFALNSKVIEFIIGNHMVL